MTIRIAAGVALALLSSGCARGGGWGAPRDAGRGADAGGAPNRVFVTSQVFNGDLRTAGGAPSGIESADALCQLYAEAGALGGTWIAWISDGSTSAVDRVTGDGPWANMWGIEIIRNRAALQVSAPLASLAYDEEGNETSGHVWTGSDVMGDHPEPDSQGDDFTCRNWTFGGETEDWITGYTGDPSSLEGRRWTYDDQLEGYQLCDHEYSLLCFEQ